MPSHMSLSKNLGRWMLVLFAAAFLLVACGSDDDLSVDEDLPLAALTARDALAAELDIDADSVTVQSYEQVEWGDSCLGLGGPAESCLAIPYPGWQVMLDVDGKAYEVRMDEPAKIIRFKEG